MKYFIPFLILSIIFFFSINYESDYYYLTNSLILSFIFLISFSWEYSVFGRVIEAEYKIRSINKKINLFNVSIGIMMLFLFLFNRDKSTFFISIFLFNIIFLQVIFFFLYKRKKPYTIFVTNNTLIINSIWFIKRDLNKIRKIKYSTWNKNLSIGFESKSDIFIYVREYDINDLKKLLLIFKEKSSFEIIIPKELQ